MRIFLAACALVLFLAPHALYAQSTPASERPIAGLGHAHMDTSRSPGVAADFDRALALLHNFWYARALEAFAGVAARPGLRHSVLGRREDLRPSILGSADPIGRVDGVGTRAKGYARDAEISARGDVSRRGCRPLQGRRGGPKVGAGPGLRGCDGERVRGLPR